MLDLIDKIKRRYLWFNEESVDNLKQAISALTHVRLDREHISKIENLEGLNSVTNLYLQYNCIQRIENLYCLASTLQFLTLASNKITIVQGLKSLKVLGFLDLSDNFIERFDIDELPKSLVFVLFKNNKCASLSNYRQRLIENLPKLKTIDNETIEDEVVSCDECSSGDESSEEEEILEKVPEISELCTELLVRSTSRLDEIVNEHQVRIKDIQSGRNPEESFNAKSKQSDCNKELLQIEDDMKNLLHVIVEAEQSALHSFDLPVPSMQTEVETSLERLSRVGLVQASSRSTPSSQQKSPASIDKPSSQPHYVSMGTSTSVMTPSAPEIASSSHSRFLRNSSKHRANLSSRRADNLSARIGNKNRVNCLKSTKSNHSSSVVRISGARPFVKS